MCGFCPAAALRQPVLRLTRIRPGCPRIAGSHGLPAHSVRVFYAAERAAGAPPPDSCHAAGVADSSRSSRAGLAPTRRGLPRTELFSQSALWSHRARTPGTAPPATAFRPRQKHARRRAAPILTVGASPAREPSTSLSQPIRWQHARPPVSACSFSGIKDQRRAQKNGLRHFSERGYRGAAQVSRRTARRGAGAGQNLQSKGVGVFQRGFAGKPAPTVRTGASPWGAAPRGCRSICRAAHRHWGPCSATDSPRPARRTPARPAPSATPLAAATSARQCG
jgi:hypothetical protein